MGGSSSGGGKSPIWNGSFKEAEDDWERQSRSRRRTKFFRIWWAMFMGASVLFVGSSFVCLQAHPLHLIGEVGRAFIFCVGAFIVMCGLMVSNFHWRLPMVLLAMYATATVAAGLLFGTLPWILFA